MAVGENGNITAGGGGGAFATIASPSPAGNNEFNHNWQTKMASSFHGALQRAGSALVSGLKSCDDANTDTLNELRIGSGPAANRSTNERMDNRMDWGKEVIQAKNSTKIMPPSTSRFLLQTNKQNTSNITIHGQYNFVLDVTIESSTTSPGTAGGGGLTLADMGGSGNPRQKTEDKIIAVARDMRTGTELPLRCLWKRKVAGVTLPVDTQKGSQYTLSADDVAARVLLEASINGHPDRGIAFAECGPFDLECSLRKNIENYLRLGGTRFVVQMGDENNGSSAAIDKREDMTLHVSENQVKLIKAGPQNIGFVREWSTSTSPDVAIATVLMNSPTEFELCLEEPVSSGSGGAHHHQDQQQSNNGGTDVIARRRGSVRSNKSSSGGTDKLRLNAVTRRQRDLIVLTIRCFQAKAFVKTSVLLEQVTKNTLSYEQKKDGRQTGLENEEEAHFGSSTNHTETTLDFYLIVNQLARALMSSLSSVDRARLEKTRAVTERDALESDMNACIQFYKNLLAEQQSIDKTTSSTAKIEKDTGASNNSAALSASFNPISNVTQIESLKSQVKEAQDQARKYLDELEAIRKDQRLLSQKLQEKEKEMQLLVLGGTETDNKIAGKNTLTEARIAELEKHLSQLQNLNITLETKNQQREAKIKHLEQTLSRIDETAASQSRYTNSQQQQLQEELSAMKKRIKELEYEKNDVEKNFLYVKAQLENLREKEMNSTSQSLGNSTMGATSAAIEQYRIQILTLQETVKKQAQETQVAQKNASKLEEDKMSLTMRLQDMQNQLRSERDSKIKLEKSIKGGGLDRSLETGVGAILPPSLQAIEESEGVSYPVSFNDYQKLLQKISRQKSSIIELTEKCRKLAMLDSLDSSVRQI